MRKKGEYIINNCLGSRQAWKWIRKNKWKLLNGKPIEDVVYSRIVTMIDKLLAESLLEGHIIVFPHQMGSIRIDKNPTKVLYRNGKVIDTYRVDWKKTLDYWEKDSEAKKQHMYIKRIQDYKYSIRYSKAGANYRNRRYYLFRANRHLTRTMLRAAEEGRINA